MEIVEDFAKLLEKEQEEGYISRYGNNYPDLAHSSSHVTITYRKKYVLVDVGRSGKYMIVLPGNPGAFEIHGIKAYGVIHPKKIYGTLETINEWYWGGYVAVKKST